MTTIATNEMTREAALKLTTRINSSAQDLAELLQQARAGKAWAALGYATWKDYIAGEIRLSRSRVYQLLDHAEIRQQIQESSIAGHRLPPVPNERVSGELKKVAPARRPEVYAAAVENAPAGKVTARHVEAVVQKHLAPAKPEPAAEPVKKFELNNIKRSWAKSCATIFNKFPVAKKRAFAAWITAKAQN